MPKYGEREVADVMFIDLRTGQILHAISYLKITESLTFFDVQPSNSKKEEFKNDSTFR